jgi:hypothetical protein
VVPVVGDDPFAYGADDRADPAGGRRTVLVLLRYRAAVEEAGTAEADGYLGVGAESYQVTLLELVAAAPAQRCRRLRLLVRDSHVIIMCPSLRQRHSEGSGQILGGGVGSGRSRSLRS